MSGKKNNPEKPRAAIDKKSAAPVLHPEAVEDLPMDLPINGIRFSLGPQATWRELYPFTSHDDGALRRREKEVDPETNAPWIPPAVIGKRDAAATLRGICRYKDFLLANRDGLPDEFANMGDFEAQTGFPREMIKYAIDNGCRMRDGANRCKLKPFLKFFRENDIWKKIFSDGGMQIKGLKGFEDLDSDMQLARLRKEQADALVDEKLIRQGTMVHMNVIEEEIEEKGLAPLRANLIAFGKTYAGQLNPENPGLAKRVCDEAIGALLKKMAAIIRNKKPAAPVELTEWWECVCGRKNPLTEKQCCSCDQNSDGRPRLKLKSKQT